MQFHVKSLGYKTVLQTILIYFIEINTYQYYCYLFSFAFVTSQWLPILTKWSPQALVSRMRLCDGDESPKKAQPGTKSEDPRPVPPKVKRNKSKRTKPKRLERKFELDVIFVVVFKNCFDVCLFFSCSCFCDVTIFDFSGCSNFEETHA